MMIVLWMLLAACSGGVCVNCKISSENPQFDHGVESEIQAVSGKPAYLVCKVHNVGNKTVSWIRHHDLAILSSGQDTYADDNRFALYHKPTSEEWVLKIKFVRRSDEGTYECQIPTIPPIGFAIKLTVIVPQTHIIGGNKFFVDIGSTLNLSCTVTNSPEPLEYIFWYHNDSAVDQSSSRVTVSVEQSYTSFLVVTQAVATDSGIYTCSAANSRPAKVKVHVLKVEIPAAMQTNSGSEKSVKVAVQVIVVISALLSW